MTKTASALALPRHAETDSHPKLLLDSILVDIDASANSQPALALARVLARRSGARLRVVDVDPRVLLDEVERSGHDLVLRSQERDLGTEGVNHQLFRHCPCPVWSVAPRPKLHNPRILVAVDALSDDPSTRALDTGAVRLALLLRGLLGGEVTLLQAWNQPAEKKLRRYPFEAAASIQTTEGHAADRLLRFVGSFGARLRGSRIELRRGAVEEVVPALVVSEGIDIVIAAAPAETGIWRLLFGSVAERLLNTAPCSVIAFKQPTP